MQQLLLLLLISPLASSMCLKWSTYMSGGTYAKISDWPFITYLNFHQNKPLWKTCGGALVARNFVLTAAHCIEDIADKPQLLTVGVGRTKRVNAYETGKNFSVSKIIPHPKYVIPNKANSFDYDIAILKLSGSIQKDAVTVKIPSNKEDVYLHSYANCKVAGWGTTSEFSSESEIDSGKYNISDDLVEAPFSVVDKKHCIADALQRNLTVDKHFGKNFSRIICAGEIGANATSTLCMGDSGSPLVCADCSDSFFLQGIVIGGSPLCKKGATHLLFTQVSKYKQWIDHVITTT